MRLVRRIHVDPYTWTRYDTGQTEFDVMVSNRNQRFFIPGEVAVTVADAIHDAIENRKED